VVIFVVVWFDVYYVVVIGCIDFEFDLFWLDDD